MATRSPTSVFGPSSLFREIITLKNHRGICAICLYCYFAAVGHILLLPFWLPLPRLVSKLTQDDAFYYLKIAQYLATEARSTFDAINWTNGFHPLWGWVLAAFIFPIQRLGEEWIFRLAFSFNALILAVAGYYFCRIFRRFFGETWMAGLPVFAAIFFFSPLYLMETALVLLMTAVCADWLARHAATETLRPIISWIWLGIALAALGLSRLDSVFAGGCIFLLAGAIEIGRSSARRAVAMLGVAAGSAFVPLFCWAGFVRGMTGHWGTISGALKMDLAHPTWHGERLKWLLGLIGNASVIASGIVLLAGAVCLFTPRRRPGWLVVALALAGGTIAHLIFQTTFVTWGVFGWSVAPYGLVLIVPYIAIVHFLSESAHPRAASMFILSGLLFLSYFSAGHVKRLAADTATDSSWTDESLKAAVWVRDHLPQDAVLGMTDTGVFGYFSERRVVNLDGIVNSWEYQEALREDRVLKFLKESGVEYIAHHAIPDSKLAEPFEFKFYSHYHKRPASPILLQPGQIAYASEPAIHAHGTPPVRFIIWKLADDGA